MADRISDSGLPRYAAISPGDGWNGLALSNSCLSDVSGHKIVSPSTQQWREWLVVLAQNWRQLPEVRVLKTSETVEVLETQLPRTCDSDRPLQVICKQTKLHGFRDAIAGFIRPSTAHRNFERAQTLRRAGIGTAVPLAYLERRSSRTSWLITEFLDGVIDLDAYVLTVLSRAGVAGNRTHRNAVIRALAQVFRSLESAGLYHRDMKASNILFAHVSERENALRACIVDLDGLATHRPWRSVWKPIVRLAASLLQYPVVSRTDCARFLREYLITGGQDARDWRKQIRRLGKQAARYSQAAHKRKSGKLDGFTGNADLRSA